MPIAIKAMNASMPWISSSTAESISVSAASSRPRLMDKYFTTVASRHVKSLGLLDKVKPLCWYLYRKHRHVLPSIIPTNVLANERSYCDWLCRPHLTFFTNALYLFFWFMDVGRHAEYAEGFRREKKQKAGDGRRDDDMLLYDDLDGATLDLTLR